jgi:hypothetical protein
MPRKPTEAHQLLTLACLAACGGVQTVSERSPARDDEWRQRQAELDAQAIMHVGAASKAHLTENADIPRLRRNPGKPLANGRWGDSATSMIRPGFLDSESRRDLIDLARDGSAEHRLARRANALLLLDQGMSCQSIAKVLFLDVDTVRTWYHLYQEDGIVRGSVSVIQAFSTAAAAQFQPWPACHTAALRQEA